MASQEEIRRAAHNYVAEMLKAGMTAAQMESKLMEQGLDQHNAASVVRNLLATRAQALNENAKKNMLYGGICFLAGIVVTLVTFMASSGGGTYILVWGAIIFGGFQFFRGLLQYKG
jgi:hypothetical protein